MGDKQQSATFPTPPPFYKHFTNGNVCNAQQHQKRQEQSSRTIDELSPASVVQLPSELRYLIPPQPPADGKWRTFGYDHDLNAPDPTLEDAGIPRLYPDHPSIKLAPQAYLIALARSLLATFLSTCGVLAQNPGLYEQKTKDLRDMVYNMHDLINQYRPHQARESLILMMEDHVDQLRQEIKAIGELKDKMHKSMEEIHHINSEQQPLGLQTKDTCTASAVKVREEEQETAWEALKKLENVIKDESEPVHTDLG